MPWLSDRRMSEAVMVLARVEPSLAMRVWQEARRWVDRRGRERMCVRRGDDAVVALGNQYLRAGDPPLSREAVREWRNRYHPEWSGYRMEMEGSEYPLESIREGARRLTAEMDLEAGCAYELGLTCYTALLVGHDADEVAGLLGEPRLSVLRRHENFLSHQACREELGRVRRVLDMSREVAGRCG